MPTGWNETDINVLRAHLQHALAEREASALAADWSYTDGELLALRDELRGRERLHAAAVQREGARRAA